ncbi:MAG: hypothetical protein AAF497_14800 [Planctomycetota bacterium]
MDRNINELRMDSPNQREVSEATDLPTWCAFALGGIVTFLFVYIGIARPAAREMAMMRRQMSMLEQSVWEVSGHRKDAKEAANLLDHLNKQHDALDNAKRTLEEIRQLNVQLAAESERVQSAMLAVSQLASLKDMLLANADRVDQAGEVLSASEEIYHRLATNVSTVASAEEAAYGLIAIQTNLLNNASSVAHARNVADRVFDISDILAEGSGELDVAEDRVMELVTLKNAVVSQTGDLADAIETLELTADMQRRFHDAALSFDEIRHWLVEVVATEPLLQRTRQSIEPLLEITNLRHLAPQQLRQLASLVSQQNQAKIALKPESKDATLTADADPPVSTQ